MANLINAFGDIALDESVLDNRVVLQAILLELQILNKYNSIAHGEELTEEDL